ncbi:hypothetical protein PLICRDRAFT_311439 [Plicaturopsis crispa FD-325 SS-3]|nr:hypothetical protein PLICRDRAFT_311439 [Plicaturopsis crispa FD-325 SS-3]
MNQRAPTAHRCAHTLHGSAHDRARFSLPHCSSTRRVSPILSIVYRRKPNRSSCVSQHAIVLLLLPTCSRNSAYANMQPSSYQCQYAPSTFTFSTLSSPQHYDAPPRPSAPLAKKNPTASEDERSPRLGRTRARDEVSSPSRVTSPNVSADIPARKPNPIRRKMSVCPFADRDTYQAWARATTAMSGADTELQGR